MAKEIWAVPLSGNNNGQRRKYLLVVPVNVRSKKELAHIRAKLYGDDLAKKGIHDDIRININQAWERQYWARKMGVTQRRLRELVREKGVVVKNIQQGTRNVE